MKAAELAHAYCVVPATPSAIPRVIPVSRSARQPANPAPAAKSKPEAQAPAASSKTEKRDIRRRPDWVIPGISSNRTRPPHPATAINHPAAIVVRRPAPGLIGNPRPAVVRLIYPASLAIRRPVRIDVRGSPHRAVVGYLAPRSILVEVFAAGVVAVGMLPALRGDDPLVAVSVPGIPFVFARRGIGLVLRVFRAGNSDHLPLFHARAALRRGDFRRTIANDHLRFRVGIHEDAIIAFSQRMNGRIGSIDFGIRFDASQDGKGGEALPYLDLNTVAGQSGYVGGYIIGHAQNVGVVELEFRPGALSRGNSVPGLDRRVECHCYPFAVVAALLRNVAVDKAQPRHT